jgi:hypothetical protein
MLPLGWDAFVLRRMRREARAEIPIVPKSRRNAGEFTLRTYERTRQSTQRGDPDCGDPMSNECLAGVRRSVEVLAPRNTD